jgi:hypothetical protein
MAHFAQIDSESAVQEVIVISNDDLENLPFPESEPIGQNFIASLGLSGTWIQTSYSGSFRGTFAGPSYIFFPNVGQYGEFKKPFTE